MKRDEYLSRAQSSLSLLRQEIKVARSQGRLDPLTLAEDVLCPVLQVLFDLPNLTNLNQKRQNYPAIDLGDAEQGTAFQISATVRTRKVKSTLEKFFEHGLDTEFSRLKFLFLTGKQQSYPGERLREAVPTGFDFDLERDILDLSDLEEAVRNTSPAVIEEIVQILNAELREDHAAFDVSSEPNTELLYANLVEMAVPENLYFGEVAIERDDIIERSNKEEDLRGLPEWASWKQVVQTALLLEGQRPTMDFKVKGGHLYTFHDLEQEDGRYSDLVLPETRDLTSSTDFYERNEANLNLFKNLVDRTLGQMLYHNGIRYHWRQKEYIFLNPNDPAVEREVDWSRANDGRTVYDPFTSDEDEVIEAKHLSFQTSYYMLKSTWYICIKPSWFFSTDGKFWDHPEIGDRRSEKKELEDNDDVKNHFLFLYEFIKKNIKRGLMDTGDDDIGLYLQFPVQLSEGPLLRDDQWKPHDQNTPPKGQSLFK